MRYFCLMLLFAKCGFVIVALNSCASSQKKSWEEAMTEIEEEEAEKEDAGKNAEWKCREYIKELERTQSSIGDNLWANWGLKSEEAKTKDYYAAREENERRVKECSKRLSVLTKENQDKRAKEEEKAFKTGISIKEIKMNSFCYFNNLHDLINEAWEKATGFTTTPLDISNNCFNLPIYLGVDKENNEISIIFTKTTNGNKRHRIFTASKDNFNGYFDDGERSGVTILNNKTCFRNVDSSEEFCYEGLKGERKFSYTVSIFNNTGETVITLNESKNGEYPKTTVYYNGHDVARLFNGYYEDKSLFDNNDVSKIIQELKSTIYGKNFFDENVLIGTKFIRNGEYIIRNFIEHCLEKGIYEQRREYINNECSGMIRAWIGKELFQASQVNRNCQRHGWTKESTCLLGVWQWKCYLNDRGMEDSDCKAFKKWD